MSKLSFERDEEVTRAVAQLIETIGPIAVQTDSDPDAMMLWAAAKLIASVIEHQDPALVAEVLGDLLQRIQTQRERGEGDAIEVAVTAKDGYQ